MLSHECSHIAAMVLSDRGVRYSARNDEAFTYLQAYLLRKCLNALLPQRLRVQVAESEKPRRKKVVKKSRHKIGNVKSAASSSDCTR
jgi:hypothetical protein